jgi:TBC1 domain family member 23
MLENQSDFNHAVETLLAAQCQAIASNSIAGGEHLCFIGSGHEDEDKYVNMVVSNFLQRKINFISLALGGYKALSKCIEDPQSLIENKDNLLTKSNSEFNRTKFTEEWIKKISNQTKNTSILNKLSSAIKIGDVTAKFKDYLGTNDKKQTTEKHVSSGDKIGKLYRNQANIFAIDDDLEEVNNEQSQNLNEYEEVSVETWLQKSDVLHKFKCFEIKNEKLLPAYLLITNSHIFGLREIDSKKGMAIISVRRPLVSLVKITSKKNTPEIISFKFGTIKSKANLSSDNQQQAQAQAQVQLAKSKTSEASSGAVDDVVINAIEQFYIPQAGEASKAVKMQVVKILDLMN